MASVSSSAGFQNDLLKSTNGLLERLSGSIARALWVIAALGEKGACISSCEARLQLARTGPNTCHGWGRQDSIFAALLRGCSAPARISEPTIFAGRKIKLYTTMQRTVSCSLRMNGRRELGSQVRPINLSARLFLQMPRLPSQGRGSRRLDTGASPARTLSLLPPSFLLHFAHSGPQTCFAAAARVCSRTTTLTDQRPPLSPVNPNTQIKIMSASLDTTAAQVPASPAPSPVVSQPTISPESASKSQLAAQAVAPQSAAVDHILLTPRLEAILESYSKEGQGDAELLKLLLQAKAREDEVSLSILAISSTLPHGREPGKSAPRVFSLQGN